MIFSPVFFILGHLEVADYTGQKLLAGVGAFDDVRRAFTRPEAHTRVTFV